MQPGRDPRCDRSPDACRDERREAVRVEPRQTQLSQVARAAQVDQHTRDGMAAAHLTLPRGHHEHELLARSALQQMPERLGGGRIAPVRVVEHHEQGRIGGGARQRSADAGQQPVARALGRDEPACACLGGPCQLLAKLGHERRQLRARRPREPLAPCRVAGERQLADRAHPRLERDRRLRRTARQHDRRAARLRINGGSGRVARLADSRLAQHEHHPAARARRRRLAQRRDLTIATDQRLPRVGGERPRQWDAGIRRRSLPATGLRRRASPSVSSRMLRHELAPAQRRRLHRSGHALQLVCAHRVQAHSVA